MRENTGARIWVRTRCGWTSRRFCIGIQWYQEQQWLNEVHAGLQHTNIDTKEQHYFSFMLDFFDLAASSDKDIVTQFIVENNTLT